VPPEVPQRPAVYIRGRHGRRKARAALDALTDGKARQPCRFDWLEATFAELIPYNIPHVQHHAAQLNLILRQTTDSAPGWVARTRR